MTDPFSSLRPEARAWLAAAKAPQWTSPMLASLTHERFSDPGWIFERKLDGERTLAFVNSRSVRLMSRNRQELNDVYPELVDALRDQDCRNFVADGEVVAFAGARTSFAKLQGRMQLSSRRLARESGIPVFYYLFDLMHLGGYDLTRLPLIDRKLLLQRNISFGDPIRYTNHRAGEGEKYYRQACSKGWEGLIAKRADSEYVHTRSRDWLKFKCQQRQELVIGGFTEPRGSAQGFGAILVGYYENGNLRPAGKVGTGFTVESRLQLRAQMQKLAINKSPFSDEVRERAVTWIRPKLVGEFEFSELTRDGKLRHPSFVGIRDDKSPRHVVRERPDS